MSELLAISDVLLLPSELESFGLVALEAMACEVPVIATRVGGVPEVVRDGIDGYLYEVGDVQAMADGCLSVLNNPKVRENLGKAARDRATRHFCASKIVLQYRSEEHTSELQSLTNLVCRLLLEKKKKKEKNKKTTNI